MSKYLVLLALISLSGPKDIAVVNSYKKDAEKAFLDGNFKSAISKYHYLLDSMDVKGDEIYLNLAHSYYQINDSANARTYYSQASMSGNPTLKSIAYQQLGVMSKKPESLEESLQYLKASVKANPDNTGAQYDYELVKKLLDDQRQNQQDQQNKDQKDKNEDQENKDDQNKDQENEENKEGDKGDKEQKEKDQQNQQDQNKEQEDKEGEKKDQEQKQDGEEQKEDQQDKEMSAKEKLEQMNMSEEKAQMILEAMKNSEIQFIQQQKRKATEKPKSGKPDW